MSPYIPQEDRDDDCYWESPGQLAFHVTNVCQDFIKAKKPSYLTFALVVGVLVLSIFELWRRVIKPYEKKKCVENGDVFK